MVHPWDKDRPRYQSWASDTIVSLVVFISLLIATVVTDILNGPAEPPAYLTGLLAASGMALFGAAGSDKAKSARETANDASVARRRTMTLNEDIIRTEAKTDKLGNLAREQNPGADVPPPLIDFPPRLSEPDHDQGGGP